MKPKTNTNLTRDAVRNAKLAARRERDRSRRQAKRTAEVWAMPADEVIAKCRAERQKVDGEIESILAEIEGLLK